MGDKFLEINRHFTGKNSGFLTSRKLTGDFETMKSRAAKSKKSGMSVNGISQQWMGETCHVDTDLVCATGLKL